MQYGCVRMIQTLVTRPELGQSTRTITMYNWERRTKPPHTMSDEDARSLVDLFKAARTTLDLPAAVHGRLDAELNPKPSAVGLETFILALTPRVRLVNIAIPSGVRNDGSSPLPWLLGGQEEEPLRHGLSRCCLPHLTEVRLKKAPFHLGNFDMVELEPLFLHPTLKTLRIRSFECKRRHISGLKWPNHVSKLETLELRHCLLDMVGTQSILARCSNVGRLVIELGSGHPRPLDWLTPGYQPSAWTRDDMIFDLTVFGQLLRGLSQDLIELDLDTRSYRDAIQIQGEVGSLRQLGSLRRLELMPRDLSEPASLSENLPGSLETLVLRPYDWVMHNRLYPGNRRDSDEDLSKFISASEHLNLRVVVD